MGENIEKLLLFLHQLSKKKRDDDKTITQNLRFIDNFRFMAASLSDLVDNMSGRIFKSIVCKKYEFDGLKDNRLSYKCRKCGEIRHDSINGLIKKFPIVYQFCKGDLNKFILLLRNGVYSYEDMDNWGKSDKTTIRSKEGFYSKLNLEDISDADYEHA